jgi:REP element-mobilizing transposase RayT
MFKPQDCGNNLERGDFMSRANRNSIIFEGAVYHVIIRGNNREYIFGNPKYKSFLLKQLTEYNKILDFELLAYVIMDNHYHFIIRTNKTSISEVMFNINNVLGKYLNRKLCRTGHVFEERYTCKLVTTDAYLIWLLRYIHRNPLRAGICTNLDEYRWSSHYFYKNGINSFVKTYFILNMLSPQKATAQMQYLRLIHMCGDDSDPELDQQAMQQKYNFQDNPLEPIKENTSAQVPLIQHIRKSLEYILKSQDLDEETEQLLLSGTKKSSLTDYKLQFIKEALKAKYTLKEISTFLNVNRNSISMLLSRHNISTCDL